MDLSVSQWKHEFILSVVSFDSSYCFCPYSIHEYPSFRKFLDSNSLLCPSRFIYFFYRTFSFPSSFHISYSFPSYQSYFDTIYPEICDVSLVPNHLKDRNICTFLLRSALDSYWTYNEGLPCEDSDEFVNICKKGICRVVQDPYHVAPNYFSYRHNPYIQFYQNCFFVLTSFLNGSYHFRAIDVSLPSHVRSSIHYGFSKHWVSSIYQSSFINDEDHRYFNISDFYLLFKDFVIQSIRSPDFMYFVYNLIKETTIEKPLIDNEDFYYKINHKKYKSAYFQILELFNQEEEEEERKKERIDDRIEKDPDAEEEKEGE